MPHGNIKYVEVCGQASFLFAQQDASFSAHLQGDLR